MKLSIQQLKEIAKGVDEHNKKYNYPTTPKRKKKKKVSN